MLATNELLDTRIFAANNFSNIKSSSGLKSMKPKIRRSES